MTAFDDVRALIDHPLPKPICDGYVAERLGLSVCQHANHKTREVVDSNGFERGTDICSMYFGG